MRPTKCQIYTRKVGGTLYVGNIHVCPTPTGRTAASRGRERLCGAAWLAAGWLNLVRTTLKPFQCSRCQTIRVLVRVEKQYRRSRGDLFSHRPNCHPMFQSHNLGEVLMRKGLLHPQSK